MERPVSKFQVSPPLLTSVDDLRSQRKRQLALGYRLFASFGWGDDGAGHITARDPEHVDNLWVLRSGVTFGSATSDDMVMLDPTGQIVAGDDEFGYNVTAFNIHHPIHDARPDIVSACHTHTGYGTPLSALCEPLRMSSQEACAFHHDQSVYLGENLDVTTPDGGIPIADSLAGNKLVFMGNHGMLTVGSTVASAVGFFVLAERAAEVQIKAPSGRVVADEAAAATYTSVGTEDNGWLVFEFLVRSRLGDPASLCI